MTADGARMSVFRFNRKIDEVSEIRLSTVVDGDKKRFLELFAAIPYDGSGRDQIIYKDTSISDYRNKYWESSGTYAQ